MAEFEYSPYEREIRLRFICPQCKCVNTPLVKTPEPDWMSDSHSESLRSLDTTCECCNCKKAYDVSLSTGISGGEGVINEVSKVEVLTSNDEPEDNTEERFRDEERNGIASVIPPQDIIAFNEMRSCADLFRMYKATQIDINPDFQRGVVWSNRAQSLFVDSVLKQLPIPSICISIDAQTQKRLVIDGLQRITTIIRFLDNDQNWALSDIEEVDARIRGRRTNEIRIKHPNLIDIFENFVIPVTVIRCDYSRHDHMQYLFQIFHRLNSGGSKLYNQEIRNCIFQGPFNTLLKKLARSSEWCAFAKVKPEDVVKARFGHEERVLRFFAFFERWQDYRGRFAAFLSDYMEDYKNCSPQQIEKFQSLFISTISVASRIEGKALGKVVADAVLVGIANNTNVLINESGELINALYRELLRQDEFSPTSLSEGLSHKEGVIRRIKKSIEVFSRG